MEREVGEEEGGVGAEVGDCYGGFVGEMGVGLGVGRGACACACAWRVHDGWENRTVDLELEKWDLEIVGSAGMVTRCRVSMR